MTKEEAIKRLMDESCKSRLYCELYPDTCMKEECEIYIAIEALRGRLKGKWDRNREIPNKCSVCGEDWDKYVEGQEIWYTGEIPNFCPNCGADMRE